MVKKTTKKTDNGGDFKTKLTEDDLQKYIDEKMTAEEIAKKYGVKKMTVINKFNKMAGAKAPKKQDLKISVWRVHEIRCFPK
jgi:DNA invertase Pin-like site-specific DNA recombinase